MDTPTTSDSWLRMTLSTTTQNIPEIKKKFPISGIVGILLGSLLFITCIIKNRHLLLKLKETCKNRRPQITHFTLRQSIGHITNYYHVATRMNKRKSRKYTLPTIDEQDTSLDETNINIEDPHNSAIIKHQLVQIEC